MGEPLRSAIRNMIGGRVLDANTFTIIPPTAVIDEHGRRFIFGGGLRGGEWTSWWLREDITPAGRRNPLAGAMVDGGSGRPPFLADGL